MSLRVTYPRHQVGGHIRTVAPAVEPVSAAQLAARLELGSPDGETTAFFEDIIAEAREVCEEMSGRALITQTWNLTLDRWPGTRGEWWDGVREGAITDMDAGAPGWVTLPRYRLQSVESVTVYDDSDTSASVTVADTFIVDTQHEPGRMILRRGAVWPVALRAGNAIEIVYKAGYGDTLDSVPAALRNAVAACAAYLYTHRGDECAAEDAYRKSGAGRAFGRFRARSL